MFFKKKKTENKKEAKVHFQQKYPARRNRRAVKKQKGSPLKPRTIKKPRAIKNHRINKVRKMKTQKAVFGIVVSIIIFSVLGFSIYAVISFITSMRGGTSVEDIVMQNEYVVGISSVPVYPNSHFAYEEKKDEEIVMRMLNQGLSVYRLPRNTRMSDIYEYYEEKLPQMGWEHIFTVPTSTKEKLLGQYWVKGEKGLRIHVENNDVWYEILSINQAKNALLERREAEIERKRVLESSSEQALLPDYPWVLDIPREFLTRYSATTMGELQAVRIVEIGGGVEFLIYPIGKHNEGTYDQFLQDFIEKMDDRDEKEWGVINTMAERRHGRDVLYARLLVNGENGEGVVFTHKKNFYIYTIIANEEGHPFFDKIIEEIREP